MGIDDEKPPPLEPEAAITAAAAAAPEEESKTEIEAMPPSMAQDEVVQPPPLCSSSDHDSDRDVPDHEQQPLVHEEPGFSPAGNVDVCEPIKPSPCSEIVPVASDYEILSSESLPDSGASTSKRQPSAKSKSKYRAGTKSPSDGDDIRWYFCKAPIGFHEAAASVPATEIVGRSEFFRFSVRDSLSLEEEFLMDEEALLSSWWKEFAECSEGPSRSRRADKVARSSSDFYEEAVGVPVKGGLYEVDLISRRCFPVYWSGEHRRVLRGHWFAQPGGQDWLPIREDIAEQLEFAYRSKVWEKRSFQPSGQYAARIDFQGATQGLHALFTGEEDTWEAWMNVDATGFSSMFGISAKGIRLRRGFTLPDSLQPSHEELGQMEEEETDDYCSQVPVRHLVFMVHGIGQRLEKANLVDDVTTFRRTVSSLAEKHLTHYQRHSQRVLFIPCQWRRHLKLGGETAVEQCTLEGVRALRTMVGATVHDVLYYMSPVYCQDIIDSVSSSLNKLYEKFIRRNPGYDGKISVYGHSLGSVLSFDILSHQDALVASFPIQDVQTNVTEEPEEPQTETTVPAPESPNLASVGESALPVEENPTEELDTEVKALKEEISFLKAKIAASEGSTKSAREAERLHSASRRQHTPRINYTKLQFEVDTFFAVGSPLGLFLSLRNVRLGLGSGHDYWSDDGIEEEMPCCRQMMNIFHPYDPVAYRVEPLISKDHVGQRPVFIPYHKGGKRLHIGMQEFGEHLGARSRAVGSFLASVGSRVATAFTGSHAGGLEKNEEDEQDERSYGSIVMERLSGSRDGRVDFMLQDATFEHQYISAISSHTNYWRDLDTALFILRHVYREIPEVSPAKVKEEQEARSRLLSEYGGYIEDDMPLTFASKEGIAAEMAAAEQTC